MEPAIDRILIKFRDAAAMRYVRTLYNGALTVKLDGWKQGSELTQLAARLAADPEVQTVGPDRLKRAQNTVPNAACGWRVTGIP